MNSTARLLPVFLFAITAHAEIAIVPAAADTTLHEAFPVTDFSADVELRTGAEDGARARTLLRFDVGAVVPPGATITAARLTLTALGSAAQPGEFELRRVSQSWLDSTWIIRIQPDARWTRPGGLRGFDFGRSPVGEFSTTGIAGPVRVGTAAMAADVQRWLDAPHRNFGWMLKRHFRTAATGLHAFASREAAAGAPRLEIEFTPPSIPDAEATVEYQVVFRATWTAETHPANFPAGAHWSGLIGGSHDQRVVFWRPGATASQGIQDMAERGRQSTLAAEVQTAIAANTATATLLGGGIGSGAGRTVLNLTVSRTHPLVTLTSMIAPSPDWFVGVRDLPLIERGQWVTRKTVALYPYDAGTDSGVTFTSPNEITTPRGVIRPIITPPLGRNGGARPMGVFSFRRVNP